MVTGRRIGTLPVTIGKIILRSIGFRGSGQITLLSRNKDWTQDTFIDNGSTGSEPILNPVWLDSDLNGDTSGPNDRNLPVCFVRGSTPSIEAGLNVLPSVGSLSFRIGLRISSADATLNYDRLDQWLQQGQNPSWLIDGAGALWGTVKNETIGLNWTYDMDGVDGAQSLAFSPIHFFTVWNNPTSDAADSTAKRIDWATASADAAESITSAAIKLRDVVAKQPGWGDGVHMAHSGDAWLILQEDQEADCWTLANVCAEGLKLLGIPAVAVAAYPTADGTPGFSALSVLSCTHLATTTFNYDGEEYDAALEYHANNGGNRYEGFFLVDDPKAVASEEGFTVFDPGGPFTGDGHGNYIYLQVLRSVAQYQMWVWHGNPEGSPVKEETPVPNQPHLPVPEMP